MFDDGPVYGMFSNPVCVDWLIERLKLASMSSDRPTSLLIRNLHYDCRPEDLRRSFKKFGRIKDIYLPRDYYTGSPRGFGFVQFMDPTDAAEAKNDMGGYILHGRELIVEFSEENRKKPIEMKAKERGGGRSSRIQNRRRSPPRYHSRSRSRRYSRSPPPRRHHPRYISSREERHDKGRSNSRSPAYNGSKDRRISLARGKSPSLNRSTRRSRSRSPRRIRSRSPKRCKSRSPRRRISRSPRRSISGSPRKIRSPSLMRSRSHTPEPVRRGSPNGEQYEDGSPSQ